MRDFCYRKFLIILLLTFNLSMFVLLKGATKEQSFKIGQEIAEAVTAANPRPVRLKFEKVSATRCRRHTGSHHRYVFRIQAGLRAFESINI